MIELRRLIKAETAPPQGEPWILIEKKADLYFIQARSRDGAVDAAFSWKTGTDSARIAIKSAEAWADLLAAKVVYVRDDH